MQVVFLGLLRGGDALHSLLRQMHGLYVPAVVGNTSWPEAVKADFTAQLHKFMANLTETVFEVKNKTILYIPAEQIEVRVCRSLCTRVCVCVCVCV
jgi:dynein heavy chain